MNTPWREWPVVRLVIPFIIGISISLYTSPWQPWSLNAFLVVATLLVLLVIWRETNNSRQWQWILSLVGTVAMCLAGLLAVHLQTATHHTQHYSHLLPVADSLQVMIEHPPGETAKSYRLAVRVDTLYSNGEVYPVNGKSLLYVPRDSVRGQLSYGTTLVIPAILTTIPPPGNPAAFDYRRYLANRSIYHQAYIPNDKYRISGQKKGSPILYTVYKARSYLLQTLESTIHNNNALSVASALLVGYKDLLGDEVTDAYAATGAMHVLAVSGLHVGIIFAVLQLLLRWMAYSTTMSRLVKPLLLLLGVWSFAIITGLSASVVRAATMFSFIIVGQSIRRPVSIYSSIATSAFLLLILNPYLLTEVGFQLSYSAVLGIVYLQPKLVRLVYLPHRALQWLWEISCVSIAAQVATFPISVYYFQQFPTYFLVSNLFVIPAAGIILYMGLLLFATSWLPIVAAYAGYLLSAFISLLNRIIFYLEGLPLAQINTGSVAIHQIFILYGLIAAVTYWLVSLQRTGLFLTLLLLTTLSVAIGYEHLSSRSQQITVVYQVNGHTAVGCMDGTAGWMLADSLLLADNNKIGYQILPHFIDKKCRIDTMMSVTDTGASSYGWHWQQGESRWLLLAEIPDTNLHTTVDYLVLRRNRSITPSHIGKAYAFETLVLDGSHSRQSQAFWEQVAADSGWSVHNVATMGAFVKESGH